MTPVLLIVLLCCAGPASLFLSTFIFYLPDLLLMQELNCKWKVAAGQHSDETMTQSSPVVGFSGKYWVLVWFTWHCTNLNLDVVGGVMQQSAALVLQRDLLKSTSAYHYVDCVVLHHNQSDTQRFERLLGERNLQHHEAKCCKCCQHMCAQKNMTSCMQSESLQ